jgi:hypothetical protein
MVIWISKALIYPIKSYLRTGRKSKSSKTYIKCQTKPKTPNFLNKKKPPKSSAQMRINFRGEENSKAKEGERGPERTLVNI